MNESLNEKLKAIKECETKKDFDLKEFPDQRCMICDSTENLVVHHKRYGSNLTKEKDFLVVCDKCHRKIHGIRSLSFAQIIYLKNTKRDIAWAFPKSILCKICVDSKDSKVLFFPTELAFDLHFMEAHPEILKEEFDESET
jgi:ribosomal protein L34E